MIDRIMRQNRTLLLLLAGYFMVNLLLRLALPASLELDEGQQLFLAQKLSFGYDSQPPFYNWLQYGFVQLFGNNVLALALLKNLLLFLTYLFFGLTANLLLDDRRLAAVATLGLITIPQISFEAQRDLSHTVAVLFAACLFMYGFMKTLKQPSAWTYALTGLATGIGVLSKYNFALLPIAALLAVLPDRDFRRRLADWRLLLTIAVSVAIVLPHGLWFLDHVGLATQRTLGKLVAHESSRLHQIVEGLIALAGAIVAFFLPTLLVFWIAFGRSLGRAWKASSPSSRLIGRMFVIEAIALAALVLFAGAVDIKPRWLVPFFVTLPLYLCLKIEASGATPEPAPRRFGMVALAIMTLVALALFARIPILGALGRYEKQNVPYGPAIEAILGAGKNRPSLVAVTDQQLSGNFRLHASDIPAAVPGFERLQPAYAFDMTHPVLLVWRDKGKAVAALPDGLATWLKAQPQLMGIEPVTHDIALPYHYGRAGDAYHFSYAWLYPVVLQSAAPAN